MKVAIAICIGFALLMWFFTVDSQVSNEKITWTEAEIREIIRDEVSKGPIGHWGIDTDDIEIESTSTWSLDEVNRENRSYAQGFNDGITCIALVNLELQVSKGRATFGEMGDICRSRHNVKNPPLTLHQWEE